MPFAQRTRDYYKWGTEVDANEVGTWGTILNGVASGFQNTTNIETVESFAPVAGDTWEMMFKLKTGSNVTDTQQFLGGVTTSAGSGLEICVASSKWKWWVGTGTSYNLANGVSGTYVVLPNTVYWVKVTYDGANVTLFYSLDGKMFTKDLQVATSSPIHADRKAFGCDSYSNKENWSGSIDFNETYINLNGQRWWDISKPYERIGSWIDEGVAYNFAKSNYLTITEIPSSLSSFEYMFKVTTGTNITTYNSIFGQTTGNYTTPQIASNNLVENGMNFTLSQDGSSWISANCVPNGVITANTTYWVKCVWDGLYLKGMYSLDGNDWIEAGTTEGVTKVVWSTQLAIGIDADSNNSNKYWKGSIDLNESYININGKEWWHGTKPVISDSEDFVYYKDRYRLFHLGANKRTYYKYGNEIDANVVGSFATILNGEARCFGTSTNYLKIPEKLPLSTASSWELVTKFTYATHSDSQRIISEFSVSRPSGFGTDVDNLLALNLSNDHSTNNIGSIRTSTVLENGATYWAKAEFTGSEYNLYLSTDGVVYNLENTISSSEKLLDLEWSIGVTGVSNYFFPFKGSIDISQSYININGERWWSGDSYTKVGSWIDEGVVNGLSKSNYLTLPDTFNPSSDDWEIVIGLITGSTVSGGSYNQVFYTGGYNSKNRAIWAYIDRSTGAFGVGLGNGGSNWISYLTSENVVQPNTEYLIKISKKATVFTLETSTDDGITYNLESSTDATFSLPTYTPYLGMYVGSDNDYSFKGSIDLTQSYIKINNKDWWHGTKVIESNKDNYAFYEDRLLSYAPILKTGKQFTTLFESAIGGTYDVEIPEDSKVRITMVGGGGAAAMRGVYDDKGYGWGGGSGGAFIGAFELPKGTYSVTVGSANNNTKAQSGNTQTLNPSDTTTHDSFVEGVVRIGGGGSGHYNSNYVGAGGASATFEIEPLSITMNKEGNAGKYNSGGKGSAGAATCAGGVSVYGGYGTGQGCRTSEYAGKRSWINGSAGYVKIEVWQQTDNQIY